MDLDEDWRSEYMIRDSYPGRIVYRSELPAPETRPSIHPSGLLQWHAEQYDEKMVEAIEEIMGSRWGNPVTAEFRDELLRHDPRWRPSV